MNWKIAGVLTVLAAIVSPVAGQEETGVELAAPPDTFTAWNIISVVVEDKDGVRTTIEVPYAIAGDLAVFEGDIVLGSASELAILGDQAVLPPDDLDEASLDPEGVRGLAIKAMFGNTPRRWPNKTIPYELPANFPGASRVTDAIAHWEQNTAIRFVRRTDETSYVTFVPVSESGVCSSSSVGRSGAQQFVSLSANCPKGSVIHELGHVVGLGHEHTRNDRNTKVRVVYSNIRQIYWSQYNQQPSKYDDVGDYDLGSIMHYGAKGTFNINPNSPSIIALDGTTGFGQRQHLSAGDIATVARMYPN